MSLWLLLVDRNDQGLAVPISTAPRHFTQSQGGKRLLFDTSIEPDKGQALYLSAQKAVGLCGALLWREGHIEKSGTVRFKLGVLSESDWQANETSVHGESGDLLFALAFLTAAVRRTDYPPFAATGVLEQDDKVITVKPVIGVPAKITAALQVLPAGSLLFYPKANHNDISPGLHRQAEAQGVTLIAVERLEEALVRLGITIEKVYLDTPYLGLQSFSYAERSIFFGREAAIEDLQTLLLQREQAGKPGALIVAASGAGKSSLAQAGLLPALEKAGWPQTDSDNPPKPLRLALAAHPVYWTETWKPQLAIERSTAGLLRSIIDNWATQPLLQELPPVENLAQLADAFTATAPKERRFLWLIDQLEELFTLSFPYDAIDAFADFLQRLQQQGVWLVAMLRNDFYSRYQEHEATEPGQTRLIDVFGGAHYDLLKPDEAALRRIIEWPAEKAGLSFETAADGSTLAEQIAQDLREGGVDALPLLQFALRQLWDGRESGQNILTFNAYQSMSRLHGAIGQKAETVYQSLLPTVQTALPKLLWDLAIVREKHGDAGQRQYDYVAQTAKLSDYPEDNHGRALIEALADETVRLLVRDGGTVRVAHEALFRHWDTAQQQLAQLHEDMAVRERVRHEYEIWCAKGKTVDLLLMPVMRLAEGEALLQQREAFLDADLVAYIRASMQAEAERQRLEQERIQREQATAEEARQQAELAQAQAEQVARQQTELAEQQTQLAQERQEKAEKLRRKARQLLAAALVSLAAAGAAGWYWYEVAVQKAELVKTMARSYFSQGAKLVEQEKPYEALAYLAQAIRINKDEKSADLAISLLAYNVIQPLNIPMLHQDTVFSAEFSPDNTRVLTESGNKAQIWNASSGQIISSSIQHQDRIKSAHFSSDGRLVITSSDDNTARVWNSETGKPVSELMHHQGGVNSAQFSPDGRRVVTASGDKTAQIWDSITGKPITHQLQHEENVMDAQFSPDGLRIVTASYDHTARLWDAESGRPLALPMQHDNSLYTALFSPDGMLVVTASYNDTVRVWTADKGQPIATLKTEARYLNSAKFSPDGSRVMANSEDDIARMWDTENSRLLAESIPNQEKVWRAEFSPDGRQIVTASFDKTARVWDSASGKPLTAPMYHQGLVYSAQFSPNGRFVVTASDDKTARVWDTANRYPITSVMLHQDLWIFSAQFSPDGLKLVTRSGENIRIWDVETGKLLKQLGNQNHVSNVQFSPDGNKIVASLYDSGNANIWDIETGQLAASLQHREWENSDDFDTSTREPAKFSADVHKVIVLNGKENSLRVWDTETGKPISDPIKHDSTVTSWQLSHDEHLLLTATYDGVAQIWNSDTGKPIASPMKHPEEINYAEISSNNVRVVTASNDKTAQVWDAVTGKPLFSPMRHQFQVDSAKFSPDGNRVVTVSGDSFRIWDVETSLPLTPIIYQELLESAQFSPDGQKIVTTDAHTAKIWEIPHFPNPSFEFSNFLEKISGYRLNSNGGLEYFPIKTKPELRTWLSTVQDLKPNERHFIEWWLSDSLERTVSPNSKQTIKERVSKLIDHNTVDSLNEALNYWPGNPLALAKLAALTERKSFGYSESAFTRKRRLWASLALKYAPDDAAVRAIAEPVLRDTASTP